MNTCVYFTPCKYILIPITPPPRPRAKSDSATTSESELCDTQPLHDAIFKKCVCVGGGVSSKRSHFWTGLRLIV